jgi:hypothetical protein
MGSITGTPDTRALLGRILGVLGVASLASCAVRSGGDGAGDETPSSSGSESESESESSSGSMSSTSETDTDDDPILDINDPGDGDGDGDGVDCSGFVFDHEVEFVPPIQCLPPEDNNWDNYNWENVCFYPPDGVTCESEPVPDACIIADYGCGLADMGNEIGCGPFTTDTGACCYVVWGDCPVGRPWIVDGRARQAARESSATWSSTIDLEVATLDAETRVALADAWASEALSEHASVAAFTRFTIQLLALGAPRELVEASLRAKGDELRHARACFALASAYAGAPVGPGPLDIRGGLDDEMFDLDSVAQTLAAEGCIAETVSLMLLAAARDRARHPAVRAMLAAIVEEEEAHVLLAWEALAWMCRRGTALAGVVAVFRDAEQHVGFGATTERPGNAKVMREHGYLSAEERRDVASRALAGVVAPAARELFGLLFVNDGDGRRAHRARAVPLSPAQRCG